jgi:hypothetical protein
MDDGLRFDFSENEIFQALGLVVSESEAREQAAAYAQQYEPGMDWATSENALLLLALGSETGRERVARIRRAVQASRHEGWVQRHPSAANGDVERRWAELIATEDAVWATRLSDLRQRLQQEGKLPPTTRDDDQT